MAETGRIRVAKDKADLVKALASSDSGMGIFQTFADVIVFAAAVGAKHQKRVPLTEISKREPSPIRLEYFATMGHNVLIQLLGVTETEDIKILSTYVEAAETERNHIFEEYANGGLEILQNELRGAADNLYLDRILLFLSYERTNQEQGEQEFDLSKFLP
jgi:dnd system-associated protein 4